MTREGANSSHSPTIPNPPRKKGGHSLTEASGQVFEQLVKGNDGERELQDQNPLGQAEGDDLEHCLLVGGRCRTPSSVTNNRVLSLSHALGDDQTHPNGFIFEPFSNKHTHTHTHLKRYFLYHSISLPLNVAGPISPHTGRGGARSDEYSSLHHPIS